MCVCVFFLVPIVLSAQEKRCLYLAVGELGDEDDDDDENKNLYQSKCYTGYKG